MRRAKARGRSFVAGGGHPEAAAGSIRGLGRGDRGKARGAAASPREETEARIAGSLRACARAGPRAGGRADNEPAGARVASAGCRRDGTLPFARAVKGRCVYGLRGRPLRGRRGTAIFVWVRGRGCRSRIGLPEALGVESRRGKKRI